MLCAGEPSGEPIGRTSQKQPDNSQTRRSAAKYLRRRRKNLTAKAARGPRACPETLVARPSRLSRMDEEFMREMFKPYGLAPDVRVHRTPQHVQFIQQPKNGHHRRRPGDDGRGPSAPC